MDGGVKSYNDNLVGCRVKVWCPEDKSLCDGVVSSCDQSGKNLLVYSQGVEEILNPNRQEIKDDICNKGTKTCDPADASSTIYSEGVVHSYELSHKKHLVAYSDGVQEMLNLRNHRRQAEDIPSDEARKATAQARDSSSTHPYDTDTHCHVEKKHKVRSSDHTNSSTIPTLHEDHRVQKQEGGGAPVDSKLPAIPGDDSLINVNGYKVKMTSAPILEAIFEKYGDIMIHCLYKSASVRASLLEIICNVVRKLQCYDFDAILSELDVIDSEISDIEASKIRISWLHGHVAKIREVAALREKSFELRNAKVKSELITKVADKELDESRAELLLAQERFKQAEKRASALKLVHRKIEDDIIESESEEYFWRRRLDDLM